MRIRHDFHMHSSFSADSQTPAELMIKRAIALGMEGICFTEHEDIDAPEELLFQIDFETYLPSIEKLRSSYQDQIWIGTGMELGFQPHLIETLNKLPKQYPFDFIIASCHYLKNGNPFYPSYYEGRRESECYQEYFIEQFETLRQLSDYDTLGHMDYIVRYGPNQNKNYSYHTYADYIDPILRHLIEHGKCLELNTGGFKYGLGEPNPCTDIFRRYRELGGELITIGADAHAPEHIGYDFDKAGDILTSLGFRYYTIFEHRIPRQIRI